MIPVFGRAFRDFKNNLFLQVICIGTISLSVFIVSAFALLFINATEFLDAWKEGARIIVYLEEETPVAERGQLMNEISQLPGVAGLDYVSKQTAFENLEKSIGYQSSILVGLEGNPLPDALEIQLQKNIRELERIESIAGNILSLPHVGEVEFARKWLHHFQGVYRLVKVTGMVLACMFFLATLLIVANTIRLIMSARNEEIRIMRIFGAEEKFIKYPLYVEALLQGLMGSGIGLGVLYTTFVVTMGNINGVEGYVFFDILFIPWKLAAVILLSSMVIGWVGCYFSIRKFLKV